MVSTRTMSNVVGSETSSSDNIARPVSSRSPRQSDKHTDEQPAVSTSTGTKVTVNLQYLPPEILEKIVGFLPHRTVCLMRLVSRKMDAVCGGILNYKFQRLQTRMLARFQEIKTKMPRRESARRNHPLACESDIIETLHMRLTLLQMTFGKHIERKHCCFFAGEILDECDRILRYIKTAQKLARPYKVTDELYDLSTMAMEYFKEHIEPTLPEIAYFSSDFLEFTGSPYINSASGTFLGGDDVTASPAASTPVSTKIPAKAPSTSAPIQSNMVLRKRITRLKLGMKRYQQHDQQLIPINNRLLKCNNQLTLIRRDVRGCRSKMAEQQQQIVEYTSRMDDYDKKNEETSRKFSTLLQELNKCKTELQYWRSKVPAPPTPTSCNECGNAFVPVPNEDLAALANQGILPEGWPDLNNLLPVAGTSKDDDWSMHLDANKVDDETNKKEGGKRAVDAAAAGSGVPKKARRVLERRGKHPH